MVAAATHRVFKIEPTGPPQEKDTDRAVQPKSARLLGSAHVGPVAIPRLLLRFAPSKSLTGLDALTGRRTCYAGLTAPLRVGHRPYTLAPATIEAGDRMRADDDVFTAHKSHDSATDTREAVSHRRMRAIVEETDTARKRYVRVRSSALTSREG